MAKEDERMLKIKELCSGYGKKEVLCDVSLDIRGGELVSIIGVNGCGKSTLLKSAVRMIPAIRGDVLVDGNSIKKMSRGEIARSIAYLSQGRDTPEMTVGEMVLHGRFAHLRYPRIYKKRDREIALEAMRKMGVDAYCDLPVSALSGGMKQNAYLAVALAQDSEYILLDEPTTYLDISHQISLVKTLQALARDGKAVVTVMHDLPLAFSYSDRIAVIDGGRLVAFGTPKEICESTVIERIFGVQVARCEDGSYAYKY